MHSKTDTILDYNKSTNQTSLKDIAVEGSTLKTLSESETPFLHFQVEFNAFRFYNLQKPIRTDSYDSTVTCNSKSVTSLWIPVVR